MLMGGQQSDLQKYVNSRVEVRGTIDQTGSGSGSSSTAGTSPTGTAATGTGATGTSATGTGSTGSATGSTASGTGASASGPMQHLRVTSVRQLASSCSGQ
jgi:hypothetical protein